MSSNPNKQPLQICCKEFRSASPPVSSCRDSSLRYRVVSKHEGGGAGDLGPICLEAWPENSGDISPGENSDGTTECDIS